MQTDLKLLLQKFSDGELTINMFIRKIRDISELSPKECNCKKLVIKSEENIRKIGGCRPQKFLCD